MAPRRIDPVVEARLAHLERELRDVRGRTAGAAMTAATSRTRLPRLRPYQARAMRAILQRIDGASDSARGSIVVEVARQDGKNELSAQLELLLLLARSSRGGSLVKRAPTLVPQARLSRDRLLQRARDAGLDAALQRSGEHVRCGSATVRFLSAEPSANVRRREISAGDPRDFTLT